MLVAIPVSVVIGWYVHGATIAAPDKAAAPRTAQGPAVQTVNGETVVVVAPDAQRASAIKTQRLAASTVQPERLAYATVVDAQPLFDLRYRLAAAREDVESTQAMASTSRAQYERDETLMNAGHDISEKTLQDAGAAMQADQDKLDTANVAKEGIEASLRLQFGAIIAAAATEPNSDLLHKLSNGKAVLLLVSLPGDRAHSAPDRITVEFPEGQPLPAHKISASTRTDPSIQGSPYFYVADRAIPVGTHMIAHVPLAGKGMPCVLIPNGAILWYGGQRWVYVKTAGDRFTRRPVPPGAVVDNGLAVTSGFNLGEAVVLQGGQLLLSEELRPRGITAQCKDPPECDD